MLDLELLNEEQRQAVTWGKAPLLLLAGPGSGKTFTIISRIEFLLEKGIQPENILVITFTKEAARSMQERFFQISNKIQPVNFGTFHSVFYHILKDSGHFRQSKILTNSQKKNILKDILDRIVISEKINSLKERAELVDNVIIAISFYKNTLNIEKAKEKLPDVYREYFENILEKYRISVTAEGYLDFDDMLFECKMLLIKERFIREKWQKQFQYILVDEFQDINQIQYDILKLLYNPNNSIFVVGDDDQAIYGFRGSMPSLMKKYQEEFTAEKLILKHNYRSTTEIVEASLAVINQNQERYDKNLIAVRSGTQVTQSEGGVHAYSFISRVEQLDYISEILREAKINTYNCAVLFRTNSYMQSYAAKLDKAGIPFYMSEIRKNIYDHFIVKDITAYLKLVYEGWDRTSVIRIMNSPKRGISREAVADSKSWDDLLNWYKNNYCLNAALIIDKLELLKKQLNLMKRMTPFLAVNYIFKAIGYEDYLKIKFAGDEEKRNEIMEVLNWIKNDLYHYNNFSEWEAFQIHYAKLCEQEKKGYKTNRDGIYLMTAHASKGLEFDYVIIPDCNEKMFPYGGMPDKEIVEEERRLFYVAMTRAKNKIDFLYVTGEGARTKLRSRFLNPLIEKGMKVIEIKKGDDDKQSTP